MSIFICVICSNEYNKINKKPRSLPCGHVFCEECVSSFIQRDSKGTFCKCPLDKKIHKNLNLMNIPICVQILENIPSNLSLNNDKEITNYINEVDNKIKIIQKQINSYKKVEQGIIDYFNEEIKKINSFFDSLQNEILKKKNVVLEKITNIFKEQNIKIEKNRKIILDYTLKLDEIIKTYESMTSKINFEDFLKEKKKTDKDINTIITYINNNIVTETQKQNYPFYNVPKEISLPYNIIGELKINNKINSLINNNDFFDDNNILNETQSEIGNATNIFNQNLYNDLKNIKTPIKKDENLYIKEFYRPENSNQNLLNLNDEFFNQEYEKLRRNETEKISNKKRLLTARDEKKTSHFSLSKNQNLNRKYSSNEKNDFLHYYSQLNSENEKKYHSKKTSTIKKKSKEKNFKKELINNSNFRLFKDNSRMSEPKNDKIYKFKPGYISIDNENIIYKKSKKIRDINSKKILIKQHFSNNKKSITPLVKPNNPRINYGNKNKMRVISSKSYRNYNTEVIEE